MAAGCRVSLDTSTRRRVWGDSGGYCGNPGCRLYLFPDDVDVDFGELAHIIAASPGGPRDAPEVQVSISDRADHGNIILLCANCHTVIDKAPGSYPTATVTEWKRKRLNEIRAAIAIPIFGQRSEARAFIQNELAANRVIHAKYGPPDDPYQDGNAVLWRRHALATIVPNNRKILKTLDANRNLLSDRELAVVAVYRLHVEQFEARHIADDFTGGTERFPIEIDDILIDAEGSTGE